MLPGKGRKESFHDGLARMAVERGDTSAKFNRAAQRHANVTWFWLAAAGVVWYFTKWGWALIPFAAAVWEAAKSIGSTLVAVKLEKIEKAAAIVRAYGAFLARGNAPGTIIVDEKKLPYPKKEIKAAILQALRLEPSLTGQKALIRSYFALSDFQPNVGDRGIRLPEPPSTDPSKLDPAWIHESAKEVLAAAPWLELSRAETKVLDQELKDAGLAG